MNEVNVVYVPWYVKSSLDAMKIDMSKLVTDINNYEHKESSLNKLASDDLNDFIYINHLMLNTVFVNTIKDKSEFKYSIDEKVCFSHKKDIDNSYIDIINTLSKQDMLESKPFNMMYDKNTVFIILNEGFSNFIKFNDIDKRKTLLKDLVNFMFKHFNKEIVIKSSYFKYFLTLDSK